MEQKVALFDFDNTVARGDSINRLLKYDLKKRPWHIVYFVKVIIYYFLYLIHVFSFEKAKSAILFPLDSMSDDELKKFYQEIIVPTYYPHIVEEMKQKKNEGYVVILCTASSEAYMQYTDLPVDCVLGTRVLRKNHHATHYIVGKNCKNEEKINRILSYLDERNMTIDYENSYGYSDSDSDKPMLSLVKNKKRIVLKTGEMIDFK